MSWANRIRVIKRIRSRLLRVWGGRFKALFSLNDPNGGLKNHLNIKFRGYQILTASIFTLMLLESAVHSSLIKTPL